MDGTECQDSPNQGTMLSEPVVPALEGYPDVQEFDELMKWYEQLFRSEHFADMVYVVTSTIYPPRSKTRL